jgi:DNA polymerase-3 subunit gamma/tau
VYEGARLEGFDGTVLELSFPEELAIYVKLAGEPKRLDSLREVLEEHLGASPRLEFRVGDGAPVEIAPPQEESPLPDVRDAGDERPEISGVMGGPEAQGSAPGEAGSDEVIRDQREVFEMARERFGLFDHDKGS